MIATNNEVEFETNNPERSVISYLGNGVKAYIHNLSELHSPFDDVTNYVSTIASNEFHSEVKAEMSHEELYEAKSKQSGLSLDFGFFSFGHKLQKSSSKDIKENTAKLLIRSYREANHIALNAKLTTSARAMNRESFYRSYGCYYVAGAVTGYHCDIYLSVECSSKQEAQTVGRQLGATISTSDGSMSMDAKKHSEFLEKAKKLNITVNIEHNLPSEILKEVKLDGEDENEFARLSKALKIATQIDTLSVEKCRSVIRYELKKYLQNSDDSYAFTDTSLEKLFAESVDFNESSIKRRFDECLSALSACYEYRNHKAWYKSIADLESKQRYFEDKLDAYHSLIGTVNENPWANINKKVADIKKNYTRELDSKNSIKLVHLDETVNEIFIKAVKENDKEKKGGQAAVDDIFKAVTEASASIGLKGEWTICNGSSDNPIWLKSNACLRTENDNEHGRHKITAVFTKL
ncbi:hypothetical protein [Pseudoalteromonas rubra]|uniref:hypothetical protein n=1 Tax=Pseudoalteromonas rubra TaxID=43658 RepID=UPI000F791A8C|nr:hypothetical protein [Pseudoalteromonas rubra]